MEIVSYKKAPKVKRIPSNVFVFDWLTNGGIPEGRFTLFYGDKSTNKSSMALRITRNFLRENKDRKVLYVDFENAFDPEWADTLLKEQADDRLLLAQPAYAEEGIELLQEATQNPEIGLYIIDSLAMIIPAKEAEADADQSYVGLLARTINSMLRKMTVNISQLNRGGTPVTVILINQLRMAIDRASRSFYAPSYSKPGGKLQDAIASMEIRFYQGKTEKKKIGSEDIPFRQWFNFVIEKNKVGGVPKVVGAYPVTTVKTELYDIGDVTDEAQIINALKDQELLVKKKSKYQLWNGDTFSTQRELVAKMIKEPEYKEIIISELIKKMSFVNWQN